MGSFDFIPPLEIRKHKTSSQAIDKVPALDHASPFLTRIQIRGEIALTG
ncbi:unnamed protein product [Acidithrix sp. C25]|nr:unnamed protein product [Acidithrix sp. C25]